MAVAHALRANHLVDWTMALKDIGTYFDAKVAEQRRLSGGTCGAATVSALKKGVRAQLKLVFSDFPSSRHRVGRR